MIGQHSIPVIVEAIAKGLASGVDPARAYALLKEGEKRYGAWRTAGYVSADDEDESSSKTLEAAYDDAALARLASMVGRESDGRAFIESSRAYTKLFDPETGFFRARRSNGTFVTPFDPRATSRDTSDGKHVRDYTEGNAWEYLWFVPHDVPGLVTLLGGRVSFAAKLDAFFGPRPERNEPLLDMTGLIGEYAQGNEPSHHVAFLYTYVGQSYKTQARVREIVDTMYTTGREGLPGNEDCGQMSAWYVLASLGIYPVNPPDGIYVVTSPNVRRAELRAGRRPFVITSNASRDNRYIQSVRLNGAPLERPWIRHAEIANGGTLAFTLGPLPNERWGRAPDAMPPSGR